LANSDGIDLMTDKLSVENFDKGQAVAPAPQKLSTFDWLSEKATELKSEASHYLADKSNRQMAIEGATLAVGLAASAILHVNLTKSGKFLEGLVAGNAETAAAIGEDFRALAGKATDVIHGTAFDKLITSNATRVESVASASSEPLFDGGFTLPRHVTPHFVSRVPPPVIRTRLLPHPDDPQYDLIVAHRLNLRLDLAEDNAIGIMHPRFRNGAKQIQMLKSLDRNLSLYGNNESGVGVLEYERLPSVRPYFRHADSVVRIKVSGGGLGIGTGTLISKDGLIATAAHVVPLDRKIMVDTIKGQFEARIVARKLDAYSDKAAIQLVGVPKDISFPVPPMSSAELKSGMRAAAVGHAQGLSGKFASIGRYLEDTNFDYVNFKGTHHTFALDSIMEGYSGGPIFDANGNFAVISTNMFKRTDGVFANINRGTITGDRIEDLLALIEEQKRA
jgi:S1-C subfamily serine protease